MINRQHELIRFQSGHVNIHGKFSNSFLLYDVASTIITVCICLWLTADSCRSQFHSNCSDINQSSAKKIHRRMVLMMIMMMIIETILDMEQ